MRMEYAGTTEKRNKKHVGDILEYLDGNDVLFPNSIILAISEDIKLTKARGPKIDSINTARLLCWKSR